MPAKPAAATVSAPKLLASLRWFALSLAVLLALSFYRSEDYIYFGSQRLIIETVSTPEKIVRGLSGRDHLPAGRAMLFAFEESQKHCFWMKDMKFAIDIIWLDADKKVIKIDESVAPETYPASFCANSPARYVLEANAGWAERVGLEVGATALF